MQVANTNIPSEPAIKAAPDMTPNDAGNPVFSSFMGALTEPTPGSPPAPVTALNPAETEPDSAEIASPAAPDMALTDINALPEGAVASSQADGQSVEVGPVPSGPSIAAGPDGPVVQAEPVAQHRVGVATTAGAAMPPGAPNGDSPPAVAKDQPIADDADGPGTTPVTPAKQLNARAPVHLIPTVEPVVQQVEVAETAPDPLNRADSAFEPASPRAVDASRLTMPQAPMSQLSASGLRQVAELLHNRPDAPVEITMNPEELGRVRISLTQADGGLTITVQAEQAHTLDLFRRHADQLQQELMQLGYGGATLDFGQQGRDAATTNSDSGLAENGSQPDPTLLIDLDLLPSDSLDIRL